METDGLPIAELALAGPLRDRLVAAILSGAKTSTSSLVVEYEHEGEPLPRAGGRSVVVDSAQRPLAVIEATEVRVLPLAEVDLDFARDEGEGFESVAEWRTAHERFWTSDDFRAAIERSDFEVHDETLVVAERFRVVQRLDPEPSL